MYLTILLVLHIGGAIIGFGPTFSFAVLGPMAAQLGGPQSLGILKGIAKIEKRLVYPFIIIQPLTGALLIFKEGLNHDFFGHYWLWISILLFATAVYLAVGQNVPATEKMIELAEKGEAGTPQFMEAANKSKTFGPILTLLLVAIIVLMIWKPGGF
jgi:uncharacterized membrane protein